MINNTMRKPRVNTYASYSVSFSSLIMTITTTVNVESLDEDSLEDMAIDYAAERIDYELGISYTDTCHSVHVELLEMEKMDV